MNKTKEIVVLALLAGFIVLLFEGSMDEFLWPLVWTSVYLIPALLIFVFSIVKDKIVDDKRFLLRMNDGNIVYINTINIEKFNNYLEHL